MSRSVVVPYQPMCDICRADGKHQQAQYDAKTKYGPWAYMCEQHFQTIGVGLGTGRGQRLIVNEEGQ